MAKLIVTDLDGTLLRDDKTFNQEIVTVIKELAKQDIHFCLASGRPLTNLARLMPEIKDTLYYVGDNGGSVMVDNEVIFTSSIDYKSAKEILEEGIKLLDTVMVVCQANKAYIFNATSEAAFKEVYNYYPITVLDASLEEALKEPIIKVSFWQSTDANLIVENFEKFKKDFNVVIAGKHWLDIMNKGINKEEGVKQIAKELKLNTGDIYIFGDYTNDLELFNYPNSYAPSNAVDLIKARAKEVILSNNEDCVLVKIKELFL